MSELISGKIISAQINEELRNEVEYLKDRGVEPCLAVILVGEDPASAVYVRNKKRTCAEPVSYTHLTLPTIYSV